MIHLLQDAPWWCPMCGTMHGTWGWGMMLFTTLFWLAVIALVVWLIVRVTRGGGITGRGGGNDRGAEGTDRAEETLRERYARGEIDRETYERMLEDLSRG